MIVNRLGAKGFTLIEILVVLMMVGLVIGGATVMVGTNAPTKQFNGVVEKFVDFCSHASQLAVLDGEPVGLIVEPPDWRENPFEEGWRFRWQKMTLEGWQDIEGVDPVELPLDMEVSVLVEDKLWTYKRAPKIIEPIVVFYPSGDATDFEIEFTHKEILEKVEHVEVNDWGEVSWREREEQEEERRKYEEQYN